MLLTAEPRAKPGAKPRGEVKGRAELLLKQLTLRFGPLSAAVQERVRAGEIRYITFGMSERGRLLVVSHTSRGERVRIISARIASKGEREIYEEG